MKRRSNNNFPSHINNSEHDTYMITFHWTCQILHPSFPNSNTPSSYNSVNLEHLAISWKVISYFFPVFDWKKEKQSYFISYIICIIHDFPFPLVISRSPDLATHNFSTAHFITARILPYTLPVLHWLLYHLLVWSKIVEKAFFFSPILDTVWYCTNLI